MNHTTCHRIKAGLGLFIPLIMITAGCGPSLQETRARDHLANAKAAHAVAKANPDVAIHAPIPLMDADRAMDAASRAEAYDEMDHLSYLAEKKTRIAVATAHQKMALNAKKELERESERLMAQSREREQSANRAARESNAEAWTQAYKAEMAQFEVDKLKQEIVDMKGRITDRGIVLTIGDMLFETGSAILSSNADDQINQLATFMMKYPDRKVMIEGYTDNVGSAENNRNLAIKRAGSVSDRLMSRQISGDRITLKGFGEESPVASNETAMGRQQNRRVEVVILHEGGHLHTEAK
jgi:outer membrane protein OmpA-like peptidoglycan-associated protein